MSVVIKKRREFLLAEVGIVALIGCVIALSNLFNPTDLELGARMAYWIGGLLAAWVLFGLVGYVGKAVAQLLGIDRVWGYVIAIPLATIIISWSVLWWLGGTEAMLGPRFAYVWPQTLAIAVAMFAVFFVLYGRSARLNETAEEAGAPERIGVTGAALHERLRPGFLAIFALSVEDHYVHVHGDGQSEMVLMSLSEAIALMPNNVGEKVHRSWWVARSAVRSHKRDGRDIKLILENEESVPVSRNAVADLRAKGWLS